MGIPTIHVSQFDVCLVLLLENSLLIMALAVGFVKFHRRSMGNPLRFVVLIDVGYVIKFKYY